MICLKKELVKIKNFKVPPKMKEQCLSNWFACPKYLCTQVYVVNEVTWKSLEATFGSVGIVSAIALLV